MSVSAAQIGLNLFAKLSDAALAGKHNSLIAATKGARFEPIVLVDSDVSTYEGISDIMYSLQSLFTGYLLQAIALYGNVGGTKAIKELDRFNPSREPKYGDFIKSVSSIENYKTRMQTPKGGLSLESLDGNKTVYSKEYKAALEADASVSLGRSDDAEKNLLQSANLSIGKIYNVDFTSNGQKMTVPISVRLLAMIVPSTRLAHILTVDATKMTDFKERYYAWRAGRLRFISDLIFMQDLVKQHRKEIIRDKDGIYSNILRRRVSNNISTLTNGGPSLAAASNIVVMSSDTAKIIEQKLNGKFSNFTTRQNFINGSNITGKVIQGTSLMLMVIVDKFADRITIYSDGIAESTTLSLREIKNAKSSGPDVSEILKAYQLGTQPSSF